MSLILDALRRADETRERDVTRRVTRALPPRARAVSRGPWLLFIAAALAGATGAWLAWNARAPESPRVVPPPRVIAMQPAARGSSLADIPVPERSAPARGAPLTVPSLGNLPPAVRAAVPSIVLLAHVWSDDPAKRFVMLDTRVVRPGESVQDGLRLVDVTPDGAVFEWRGTAFLVPAR